MEKDGSKTSTIPAIVLSIVFLLIVFGFFAFVFLLPKTPDVPQDQTKYEIYGGMTDELKDSDLFKDLQSGSSVCFLGDSITAGTEINGIHWYEPLIPYTKGSISNLSTGGWMVEHLIDQGSSIPKADIYVVAIGINDILFRNAVRSAKTPAEFAQSCSLLADTIKGISPEAKIYFIAPWTFTGQTEDIEKLGNSFRDALKDMCHGSGYQYINPDPIITEVIYSEGYDRYMHNDFHPNAPDGVGLYSYAVLKSAHEQRKSGL